MLFLITYGHDFAASFAQYSSVLLNVEKSLSPSIMVSVVNTVALKAVDSSDRSYLRYEFPPVSTWLEKSGGKAIANIKN